MTPEDIPAAVRLKDAAGWNQTAFDWERFISTRPQGCFAAESEGRLIGTSATITYEDRLAWIGMVIVDCLSGNRWAIPLVKAQGFQFSRPLTRMVRGKNDCAGKPESQCAILGPEFG